MTYRESKAFNRYEEIILNIVKEAAGLKSKMESSGQFIVDALDRLTEELKTAQTEADRCQGQLVAEEMNGKTTTKTALAAEAATNKVVKLEQSLKALSRTGGLAIIQLEKQTSILSIKLRELENERQGVNMADTWFISALTKKARLARLDEEIKEVSAELSKLNENLKILKDAQRVNGNLVIVDANTKATAEALMQTAVNGHMEIERLKARVLVELEDKREQLKKLKAEVFTLEEVQHSLNPERIADALHGSEIEAVFLTEDYEKIDNKSEVNRQIDRSYLTNKLRSYIRQRAHSI